MKSINKDPDDRFDDVEALADVLEELHVSLSEKSMNTTAPIKTSKSSQPTIPVAEAERSISGADVPTVLTHTVEVELPNKTAEIEDKETLPRMDILISDEERDGLSAHRGSSQPTKVIAFITVLAIVSITGLLLFKHLDADSQKVIPNSDAGVEATGVDQNAADSTTPEVDIEEVNTDSAVKTSTDGALTGNQDGGEQKADAQSKTTKRKGRRAHKAVNKKAAQKKPVEKKPVEKKPVEKKPVEKKPVEKKPVEKKPAKGLPPKKLGDDKSKEDPKSGEDKKKSGGPPKKL